MTEKDVQKAINECEWKSENRPLELIGGVCTALIMPCAKGIDCGRCPTLIELFRKEKDDK